VPAGWGWGPVQVLKGWLARAGYATEEHRVAGHVMLAVTGGRPAPGTPRGLAPGLARPPRPGAITRCYITVGIDRSARPVPGPGPGPPRAGPGPAGPVHRGRYSFQAVCRAVRAAAASIG